MAKLSVGPNEPVDSDLRLKEDVRRIGTTVHDLPLYAFRYRGQDGAYEGVMAQDVLPVRPDAVTVGPDGYFRVSYEKLGLELRPISGATLLDLAKDASGEKISGLARALGPNFPDDGGGGNASDVRLKEAISQVGTTVHGLPLYSFRYRGEEGTYEGVMA